MHASSALRAEASKFFWSNPDAYFVVATQWLLDGAYPGYQCCDAAFLQYVQNVEIEFPPEKNEDIRGFSDEEPHVGQDRIETFWNEVQRRCPHVKRVVINQIGNQRLWTDDEAVPQPLRTLMQACPRTIQVSTLTFEIRPCHDIDHAGTTTVPRPQTWRRSMYKLAADNVWRKLDSRHSQTILLPIKRLGGLVGEHEEAQHQFLRMEMESNEWSLAIEALDRYHFDNGKNDPFSCPMPGCDTYFEKAGEWTVHAVESSHGWDQGRFSHFPDEIREKLDAITKRLHQRDEEISWRLGTIRETWYNAEKEERKEIEHDWIKQWRTRGARRWFQERTRSGTFLWSGWVQGGTNISCPTKSPNREEFDVGKLFDQFRYII